MSTTPHDDQDDELAGTEQPFVQHLVELRDRLIKAVIAIGVVAAVLAFYPGPGGAVRPDGRAAGGNTCPRAPR
jgi:sec-independent protein translocase protein TatC